MQKRGCWPFVYRLAMPDGLSKRPANCYVTLLSASEYNEIDECGTKVIRRVRNPKSLAPHLMIISNDLYRAYHVGCPAVDYTFVNGERARNFMCKVALLLVCGDYPGLGYVAEMSHAGGYCCHWCEMRAEWDQTLNRCVSRGHRRFLELDPPHPFRTDPTFGTREEREPPTPRTHARLVAQGEESEDWRGAQTHHPKHSTGK